MARKSIQDRFWSKVDKSSECWIWTASRHPFGYGWFGFNGRNQGAHRVSWQLAHGPIPAGLSVLHRCDVPACVNPDHLWLGTQAENMTDRDAKGRQVTPLGERHGQTKFSADQVIAIRADHRRQCVIAADYGVSHTTIGDIKRRVNWAHIE